MQVRVVKRFVSENPSTSVFCLFLFFLSRITHVIRDNMAIDFGCDHKVDRVGF